MRQAAPSIGLIAVLTAFSYWASQSIGGSAMIYALVLGFAAQACFASLRSAAGTSFCASTLLRLGVGLLGAGITVAQVADLGVATIALAVAGVVVTICAGMICARLLGLSRNLGLLLGGAVAICGASAALAIAAVLPKSRQCESETLLAVIGVTALSTLAMIAYPLISAALGMDDVAAGIFFGAAIHDIAQVVGAGYMVSDTAGETATIVKLLRVACLVPVVALIGLYVARTDDAHSVPGSGKAQAIIPWFLIMFMALSLLVSTGFLPYAMQSGLSTLARVLLTAAIVALGMKASLGGLISVGARPVLVLLLATVVLAVFALGVLLGAPGLFGTSV